MEYPFVEEAILRGIIHADNFRKKFQSSYFNTILIFFLQAIGAFIHFQQIISTNCVDSILAWRDHPHTKTTELQDDESHKEPHHRENTTNRNSEHRGRNFFYPLLLTIFQNSKICKFSKLKVQFSLFPIFFFKLYSNFYAFVS